MRDLFRNLTSLAENIPPKILLFFIGGFTLWLILQGLGDLMNIGPELFSGEEVVRIW